MQWHSTWKTFQMNSTIGGLSSFNMNKNIQLLSCLTGGNQNNAQRHAALAVHNQCMQSIPGQLISLRASMRAKDTWGHPLEVHAVLFIHNSYWGNTFWVNKPFPTSSDFGRSVNLPWGTERRLGTTIISKAPSSIVRVNTVVPKDHAGRLPSCKCMKFYHDAVSLWARSWKAH